MKSYDVTIQMKPLQQYFHMALFIKFVVLIFESLDDFPSEMQLFILKNVVTSYRHSNLGC